MNRLCLRTTRARSLATCAPHAWMDGWQHVHHPMHAWVATWAPHACLGGWLHVSGGACKPQRQPCMSSHRRMQPSRAARATSHAVIGRTAAAQLRHDGAPIRQYDVVDDEREAHAVERLAGVIWQGWQRRHHDRPKAPASGTAAVVTTARLEAPRARRPTSLRGRQDGDGARVRARASGVCGGRGASVKGVRTRIAWSGRDHDHSRVVSSGGSEVIGCVPPASAATRFRRSLAAMATFRPRLRSGCLLRRVRRAFPKLPARAVLQAFPTKVRLFRYRSVMTRGP
mmetsp:Transcript_37505/g.110781  ORF Transcript_37505/g.110781 Transcript_37505/m.110781 type:complete len:284 (-) Transcript_37505:22-873(-)